MVLNPSEDFPFENSEPFLVDVTKFNQTTLGIRRHPLEINRQTTALEGINKTLD